MGNDHKYLGMPLHLPRKRSSILRDLKEKIIGKIGGWKAKILSQASRTTLIRSVLASMPQYYMSNYLLPKHWCTKIDKGFKDFWWGFEDDKKRHFTPKAWESICYPKSHGSLGLRRLHDTNQALVIKVAWNFDTQPNSIWVKALQAKYVKDQDWRALPYRGSGSWMW